MVSAGRFEATNDFARLAEADFVPVYGGAVGELRLQQLPLRKH